MAGFRLMTWRYWALVLGVIAPLFPAAIYTYAATRHIVENEGDVGVSPLYPVVLGLMMGIPPLLLVGMFLSYLLRRPQTPGPRFLLGFAIGAVLFAIAQTGAIKF